MASTKTTTYSIYGRQAYENSFHGDTVNLDLSQIRSSVSRGTTRIGSAADELQRGSQGGQAYVYDNIARQPEVPPVHMPVGEPEYRQKTSRQVLKNRRRALSMNTAYAVFLASAAIFAVVICFLYLRLQSETVARSENITALQAELADRKEENNTRYNFVMDAVNLDEIRTKAQKDLGMVYASEDQIVEYTRPSADYVKQYEDIPEDGVLAQSDKHED